MNGLANNTDAQSTVSAAVQKLIKNAVEEGDRFYVLSSSAKYRRGEFTHEDLNSALLALGNDKLKNEQLVGLRNYFLQRAKLSNNVHSLLVSLRALKGLNQIPIVKVDGESSISLSKGSKQELKIEVLNNFGDLYQGAKSIKSSLI